MNSIPVSIGVFVYNEGKNISNLLNALSAQKTKNVKISEIIVVSSASTDETDSIVKEFSKKNKKIKLITQDKREGKASAINLFLKNAKEDVVVIESGDTIPKADCIEELCKEFSDKSLGLTGGRSIPTNDKNTILGYLVHYWWWVHNELPRFGEIIAFRKSLVPQISAKTAVDEAYIEAVITNKGYAKRQMGTAIVNNHGAEVIKDLIKQRKRVYIGHKLLKKEQDYAVESFNFSRILSLTLKYIKKEHYLRGIPILIFGGFIEAYSRVLGWFDLHFKKSNPYVWDISKSTKNITINFKKA